jgi:hypothetical protein
MLWLFVIGGLILGFAIGRSWSALVAALGVAVFLYFRGRHRIHLEGGLSFLADAVLTLGMAAVTELGVFARRAATRRGETGS